MALKGTAINNPHIGSHSEDQARLIRKRRSSPSHVHRSQKNQFPNRRSRKYRRTDLRIPICLLPTPIRIRDPIQCRDLEVQDGRCRWSGWFSEP